MKLQDLETLLELLTSVEEYLLDLDDSQGFTLAKELESMASKVEDYIDDMEWSQRD